MATNESLVEPLPWISKGNETSLLFDQVTSLLNTIYYLILIPVATVGNILTLLVVIYIVKNEKRRRSVSDLCLGILAIVDLLSVFLVHPITLGAMYRTRWTYSRWACYYQSYVASVYMKLEFLIQVLISLDRHFALVRPLKYHTFNSLVTFKVAVTCAAVFAFGTTSLTFAFGSDRVKYIDTWQFCAPAAQFDSLPDIVLNSIVSAVFVAGIIAFIVCNVTLVNILRHYHNRRATSLLQQITDAMEVIQREHGKQRNGEHRPNHKRNSHTKALQTQCSRSTANSDKNRHQNMAVMESKNGVTADDKTMKAINGDSSADAMAAVNHVNMPSQSMSDQSTADYGRQIEACSGITSPSHRDNVESPRYQEVEMCDISSNNKVTQGEQLSLPGMNTPTTSESHQLAASGHIAQVCNDRPPVPQIRLEGEVNIIPNGSEHENQSELTCIADQSATYGNGKEELINALVNGPEPHQTKESFYLPTGRVDTFNKKSRSFCDNPIGGDHLDLNSQRPKSVSVNNVSELSHENKSLLRNASSSLSVLTFHGKTINFDAKSTDTEGKNSTEFTDLESISNNKQSSPVLDYNIDNESHNKVGLDNISSPQTNNRAAVENVSNFIDNKTTSPRSVNSNLDPASNGFQQSTMPSTFQRQTSNGKNGLSKSPASYGSSLSPPGSPPANSIPDPLILSVRSDPTESWDPARAAYIQQQMAKFLKKMEKKARKQKRELLLAKLVVFCASLFIATWLPYIIVTILSFCHIKVSMILTDASLKLVFLNAFLNPVFYGLCRKTYRKGFSYLVQSALHFVCCGSVDKPGEDKVFFDSRKKKQKRHLEAVMFEVQPIPKVYRRQQTLDRSAHALHLLQQTLSLRAVSPAMRSTRGQDFRPSRRLHDLYERYMMESDLNSSEESTSSVDYEALVFGDDELYYNLQKVWSKCFETDDEESMNDILDDAESDIDLDVDYDALLGDEDPEFGVRGCQSFRFGNADDELVPQ